MSVEQAIKDEETWNNDRCHLLVYKMKIVQENPNWRNFYVHSLSPYGENGKYEIYYTECDALKNFIAENNKSRKNMEFVVHGKYVNYVRTHIDHANNKIVYNLEKSMNSEAMK